MAELTVKQVRELAVDIVKKHPLGIRYTNLIQEIEKESPETPHNRIANSLPDLDIQMKGQVSKPSRGLFKPVKDSDDHGHDDSESVPPPPAQGLKESDFYEPFAEWLQKEIGDVTHVAALGGAAMKAKWGTPDVVGTYKPRADDIVKLPVEIVSAEIKLDSQSPVIAFGQASAYRLFSAKTYVVVPSSTDEEDKDRLESLCILYGIGLVFFDPDKAMPNFKISVRAIRFDPDVFYVNDFAKRLMKFDREKFEKLF